MKNIRRNFSVPRTRRRKSFVCSVYWIMFPNCWDLREKRMIQMTVSKPLIGWMKHNKLSNWPKKTLKIFVRLPGEQLELTKISYIFNFNFYFTCCNFAHIYGLQTRCQTKRFKCIYFLFNDLLSSIIYSNGNRQSSLLMWPPKIDVRV